MLAILSCALFLPKTGTTEIRNLPVLIFIVFCITIYIIYRVIRFFCLERKIKKVIFSKGMIIEKTHISFGNGYIIAKDQDKKLCIRFLLRKRKYCRYHFASDNIIEFYKSSFSMAVSGKRGNFAKGATETRQVGEQKLCYLPDFDATAKTFIVIDKIPDDVTDYKCQKILFDGDYIGDNGIIFISFNKFSMKLGEI